MRETWELCSSLAVSLFELFSQQPTSTFLHPYFAMRKLKYSMQDRQKLFSKFQQVAAVETCDKFHYKSFLKSCLYSTWFAFIEFVFKLVVACSFVPWGSPLNSSDRKCVLTENKQAWPECHIINYLLTKLARGVLGNICPRSLCTDLAALGSYCHDLGPKFPGTALALG